MSKPREFWIEFGGDPSDDNEVYKRYSATTPFEPCGLSDEVVHTIEKKAYDELDTKVRELQVQADKLAEALSDVIKIGSKESVQEACRALKEYGDEE